MTAAIEIAAAAGAQGGGMTTQSYDAVHLGAQRQLRDTLLGKSSVAACTEGKDLAAEMLLHLEDTQECWRLVVDWLCTRFSVDRVDAGFHTPAQRYYMATAQAVASADVPQLADLVIDTHEAGVASLWISAGPVTFSEVQKDVRLSSTLRLALTAANTASKLATSVRYQRQPVGLICLDQLDCVRNWSEQDAILLKTVADNVVGPILHTARALLVLRDGASSVSAARCPSASQLTATEARVAGLVARGLSYKEIARELGRSHSTVDHHLRSIRQKLGVTSTSRLIRLLSDNVAPYDS